MCFVYVLIGILVGGCLGIIAGAVLTSGKMADLSAPVKDYISATADQYDTNGYVVWWQMYAKDEIALCNKYWHERTGR